jgi:hypothetical protein
MNPYFPKEKEEEPWRLTRSDDDLLLYNQAVEPNNIPPVKNVGHPKKVRSADLSTTNPIRPRYVNIIQATQAAASGIWLREEKKSRRHRCS